MAAQIENQPCDASVMQHPLVDWAGAVALLLFHPA